MEEHVIYKITNTVKNKIYIGQTKKYYGTKPYGIECRLQRHISDAGRILEGGCVRLWRAIRKYGGDNFVTEEIEVTNADNVDERETYYIAFYDSTNKKIGYNIALGGKGVKVEHVSEETRKKLSDAHAGETMNIQPCKDKETDETIGYRVQRREQNKSIDKWFTSTEFTPEENYQKAVKYLEDVKNGDEDKYVKYNKKSNLPQNLFYEYSKYDKGKIMGYSVAISVNGKVSRKSFQSKDEDLDTLLEKAIVYRDKILKEKKKDIK